MWAIAKRYSLLGTQMYATSVRLSRKMSHVSKATIDTNHILTIGQSWYMAPIGGSRIVRSSPSEPNPATVFTLPKGDRFEVTADFIIQQVKRYNETDDVFYNAFLSIVIFQGLREDLVTIDVDAREYLHSLGTQEIICLQAEEILPGPYAIIGDELRDVWKLVDDVNGTCMVTLKPQSDKSDTFESFPVKSSDDRFSSFALESRIKTQARSKSPLAGIRIVVKDNIDLKGIKTSTGSKAFYDTYSPCRDSAPCIQDLINRGVSIVGKTKMSSFATWEEPIESTEYQTAWNPRADRFQSPGGSSSGSAAAVSSYDWLDIAIGTDTWGSVTRPALWCGCYGLRPSLGAVSADGITPCCTVYDTAGILGRDLQKCRDFAQEWLSPAILQHNPRPFTSVIWPLDFWTPVDSEQNDTARDIAKRLASFLNARYTEISFEEVWLKSPPSEGKAYSLPEFINKAADMQDYDAYHNLDKFREDYWKQHNHYPYVTPPNQKAWNFARTISREDRDKGFARLDVYKKWFEDRFLTTSDDNSLIVMPQESMRPRYRDADSNFERPPSGVNSLALAAVLEAPALTIPVSEITYQSRITGVKEKLPFAVTVMGNAGTDLALMNTMINFLKKSALPLRLKTGKTML